MLHHISLGVAHLARVGAFHDAALAPLGYVGVCIADLDGRRLDAVMGATP